MCDNVFTFIFYIVSVQCEFLDVCHIYVKYGQLRLFKPFRTMTFSMNESEAYMFQHNYIIICIYRNNFSSKKSVIKNKNLYIFTEEGLF